VTIVRDKNAMDSNMNVDEKILGEMLERTLATITGKAAPKRPG